MIITDKTHTFTASSTFEVSDFGIDTEDLQHIITLLRNDIYSNKPLAVIRELSCNAFDANVQSGKNNTPIRVTLPSKFESKLKIRDFGYGLSPEQIKSVFIKYGKSTKRGSDNQVGCYGIGAKSPFAYTDSFTVVSYQNGIKSIYSMVLGETNVGNCLTVGNFPTDEVDGLEIIVNVKSDDVETFRNESLNFFKYWSIKPEIVGFDANDMEKLNSVDTIILQGTGWKMVKDNSNNQYRYYARTESVALMGNIAYPIKWSNVKGFSGFTAKNGGYYFSNFIEQNHFVFDFAIGEVKMSPSREALEYIDKTNNAILDKLQVIINEVSAIIQGKVDACKNLWEAKVLYNELFDGYNSSFSCMRDTAKLTYNGQPLTNANIDCKKYYTIIKTYSKRSHNVNFYGYEGNQYNRNTINCHKKACILEMDVTDKIYIQKACNYLNSKFGYTTIYALTFADANQRKDVMNDTGILDEFIIKYSTIQADVNATIVRSIGGGKKVVTTKTIDNGVRNLRVFTGEYNHWRNKLNDMHSEDVDMKLGGLYVESEKYDLIKTKFNRVSEINNVISTINKHNNTSIKVYVIGQNLINGKAFKSGNWIHFDKYVETIANDTAKKSPNLRLYMAYYNAKLTDKLTLNSEFAKWINNNTINNTDLNKLAKIFTTKYENIKSVVELFYKSEQSDIDAANDMYNNIVKEYPLINIFNHRFDNAWGMTDADKNAMKDYLNKV